MQVTHQGCRESGNQDVHPSALWNGSILAVIGVVAHQNISEV